MGAINLRVRDLDQDRQTVWLREKFRAEREQPVSASLLEAVSSLFSIAVSVEVAYANGLRPGDDLSVPVVGGA